MPVDVGRVRHAKVDMVQTVTSIQLIESVSINSDRLESLYSGKDFCNAENTICRALERLSSHLHQCEHHFQAENLDALGKAARSIVPIADQLGMERFSRVATSVAQTVQSGDAVAMAACMGRLLRIGEGSLMAIWDLQDMTI